MKRCPNCGRDLENVVHPAVAAEVEREAPPPPARKPKAAGRPPAASAKGASFSLEPAEVRALVAANPEWLEPGLRVHGDGAPFATPVGAIDLLAQDDAGGLVVVMVAEGEPDKEIVLELLQRIGFVRTRVAKGGQEVRALLIVERLSDPTRYAIAALGDTVSVKAWRVGLTFDPLPL
jgi:hypothetical protein